MSHPAKAARALANATAVLTKALAIVAHATSFLTDEDGAPAQKGKPAAKKVAGKPAPAAKKVGKKVVSDDDFPDV